MLKMKTKESIPLTGDQIVTRYFRCLDNKDIDGMLELFDYDAELYEPFSNIGGGLKGKSSIEPFVKVAMMANSNLQRTIKMEKANKPNTIIAIVTYEKGDKVKSRFTFQFEDNEIGRKKIKMLHIEFL
jgi:hypothetical protein